MAKKPLNYKLMKGDALSLLKSLGDASVDAVITDPPYCSGGQTMAARARPTAKKYINSDTKKRFPDFEGDFRDQRSFLAWASQWLSECHRVTKPGGLLLTFIDWRMLPTMTDAVQMAGWVWQGIVVWDKTQGCRPQRGKFRSQAEYIVFASRGPLQPKNNPIVLPGVFTVNPSAAEKQHQVGKPIKLMDEIIKIVPKNSTILDPFMGSATTGIAALKHECKFIGSELSEGYFDLAKKRLAEFK